MDEPRPLAEPGRPSLPGEREIAYALKILATVVLAGLILGVLVRFALRIPTASIVVIGAVLFAYLIYPAVGRLRVRMPLGAAIGLVYA